MQKAPPLNGPDRPDPPKSARLLPQRPRIACLLGLLLTFGCSDAAQPGASVADGSVGGLGDGAGAKDINPWADSVSLGSPCTSDQACEANQAPPAACHQWQCEAGSCRLGQSAAGVACTGPAHCLVYACDKEAACAALAPVACPDGLCSAGVCNLANGACEQTPVIPGLLCDDGDLCTLIDTCNGAGVCDGGPAKPCVGTICAPQDCQSLSGDCVAASAAKGTACEDGNPCTALDACNGQGGCTAGTPQDCGQGPCWTGQCNPTTGTCLQLAKPALTPCFDGAACTVGDTCSAGVCQPGVWACTCKVDSDCNDNNVCTGDACGAGSCVHLPLDGTVCSDQSACTSGDACLQG